MSSEISSEQTNNPAPETEPGLSRRRLLQILAASGGAVAGSALLPESWVKPVIEAGVLPAHAQASVLQPGCTGDLQVTMTWDSPGDIDLHVIEPDNTEVYYAHRNGPTASLDRDSGGTGPENICVLPGRAAAGTYQVFVVNFSHPGTPTVSIAIRTFDNTPQAQCLDFTRQLGTANTTLGYNVANVTYPAGTVVGTTGTRVALTSASKD